MTKLIKSYFKLLYLSAQFLLFSVIVMIPAVSAGFLIANYPLLGGLFTFFIIIPGYMVILILEEQGRK